MVKEVAVEVQVLDGSSMGIRFEFDVVAVAAAS